MSSDPHDEHDNPALVPLTTYDITPDRVRFQMQMPDGAYSFALTDEEWQKISGAFSQVQHDAKPISDQDIVYALQRIDGIRRYSDNRKLVTVVNMAKRADGKGYILRLWEDELPAGNEREWNITTWGELDAMERVVRETHR